MARRRPLSRAARLTKEWGGFRTINEATGDPSNMVLPPGTMSESWILTPDDAIAEFDEPTIMRLLVNFSVTFNPALADGGAQLVSAGIRVATDLTAALGTPKTPYTQPWLDWIWTSMVGWNDFPSASSLAGQPNGYVWMPGKAYDEVKTRRRLEAGEGLLAVVRNEFLEDGGYASASFSGRYLLAH